MIFFKNIRLYAFSLFISLISFGNTAMAIDEPEFELLSQNGEVEYRQYSNFIVAETYINEKVARDDASGEGFKRLFGYISGDNTSREKIAMTAPVIQEKNEGEKITMTAPVQQNATELGWVISFVLPIEFTLASAPIPEDERIVLREVSPRTMAVLRFSGRWSDKNIDQHEQELQTLLQENNINMLSDIEFSAYNAPFSLPFMRRNEVMVEIDESDI